MSTEDMIAEMNRTNDNQKDDNLIIGSTGVVALYPSLDIDFTIDKVCDVFFQSDVSVQGVDYASYDCTSVALTVSPELLMELDIADVCPTRKTVKGRPPTITASGNEEQKEKRFKPWNLPVRQLDEYARRIMLRDTLRVALTLITRSGSKQKVDRLD